MTPERLANHLNRIASAPDAVQHIRRFILDLAVRGKLVNQELGDESASELLKRIHAEKESLVKDGGLRQEKQVLPPVKIKPPFSLPVGWHWSRLAEVGIISPRNSAEDIFQVSFVPMSLISSEYGISNQHEIRQWGEIKKGYTHFAEGDVGLAKITPCFENGKSTVFRNLIGGIGAGTTELHIVRPILVSGDYMLIFLKSSHFINSGIPRMTGTAGQKRVPLEYVAYTAFPLPPLNEQHRIVAKVDELMALCDRLEAAQAERESRRDRLAAASLQRLNQPADEPTFREYARFHLNHLQRLTTRPEQVKQLRQTILNFAVRGQLVTQDPHDEPSAELLKHIQDEQDELTRAGVLKRTDSVAHLVGDDMPFSVPRTWQWTQLAKLIVFGPQNGLSPKPSSRTDAPRSITLTATTKGIFDPRYFKQVEAKVSNDSDFWLRSGDLLFQRGNTREYVGMAAYYSGEPNLFLYPDLMMKVRLSEKVCLRYVHLSAVAPHSRTYFSTHASGAQATMPKINQSTLVQLPIPLPPLAEQHRIVAKVDELMALCDRLETQLTATQTQSRRLLEAVLHEALAGA